MVEFSLPAWMVYTGFSCAGMLFGVIAFAILLQVYVKLQRVRAEVLPRVIGDDAD